MPLTADQSATLELLLERDRSYADLAELLGLTQAEVRDRAHDALTAIAGADPDRNVPLSDYLLGKADPIDRADAVRRLKDDADDHALAQRVLDVLAEIAPGAALPTLPPQPGAGGFLRKAPGSTAPAPETSSTSRFSSLSQRQTRLIAVLGSAAVILIAIVLGVTGAFSGDGDSSSSSASTPSTTDAAGTNASDSGNEVPIKLEHTGNSDGSGKAIFGVASGNQTYLDLTLRGLQPPTKGQAYVVWFLLDEKRGFPLPAAIPVDAKGSYHDRIAIPDGTLQVIGSARFIDVSLLNASKLAGQIQSALKAGKGFLDYPGGSVLRGVVPGTAGTGSGAAGAGAAGGGTGG